MQKLEYTERKILRQKMVLFVAVETKIYNNVSAVARVTRCVA
jgi:hypothetical protein